MLLTTDLIKFSTTKMEIGRKPVRKLPVLTYLCALLDFGFFAFTVPFRIKWTSKQGYFVHVNRVHQIFCCIIQTFVLYESISWICLMNRAIQFDLNPYYYMRMAQLLKCTTFCLVFIYTFWIQKAKFAILLKNIQALDFLYANQSLKSNIKTNVFAYGICFCAIVWAVLEFCALNFGLIPLESGSGGRLSLIVEEAQTLYRFSGPKFNPAMSVRGNDSESSIDAIESSSIGLLDIIFTIIHIIAILPHYVCVNSADKIVLLLAVLCRSLVIDFVAFAKNPERKIEEVFYNYEGLKAQIRAINDVMGMLILFFVGGCLPFYPTWTGVIFFHKDSTWFQFAQFVSFFGMFFLILGVAADVNLKIGEFYIWISTKEAQGVQIPPNKFNSIMMDMYSEQIALRGGGFFRMTYGFFGTVLSVIVTYTIIIVQFQISSRQNKPGNTTESGSVFN